MAQPTDESKRTQADREDQDQPLELLPGWSSLAVLLTIFAALSAITLLSILRGDEAHVTPETGGTPLGCDVYSVDEGDLRPWLRSREAVDRLRSAGVTPNGVGLLEDIDAAVAAARLLTTDGDPWFAWRLAEYAAAA